jgi:hypothetical protein
MAAYTAVRGAPWHDLLVPLEIDAPLRSRVFAFLVGEVTKSIPIGNDVQNYIHARHMHRSGRELLLGRPAAGQARRLSTRGRRARM